MVEAEVRQAIVDEEHLKLLSIVYAVSAGLSACVSLLGIFYAFMGVFLGRALALMPTAPGQTPPPEFMSWIFTAFGLGMFLVMIALGVLKFVVYRRLRQHRSRVFCMIVAGICCVFIPYGTLLGIFTFVVLTRPSVVRLFSAQPPPLQAAAPGGSGG